MNADYPSEDWWDEDEIALVEDRTQQWRAQIFHPSDAAQHRPENGYVSIEPLQENASLPEGITVIEGGWDHEHCRLCFATISAHPQHEHAGYINGENSTKADWLCRECYMKYIVPRLKKNDDEI